MLAQFNLSQYLKIKKKKKKKTCQELSAMENSFY